MSATWRLSRKAFLAGILIFLIVAWHSYSGTLQVQPPTTSPLSASECPHDPLQARIVVAVKTGATEAADKIPTLMQTALRCAPHVLFFSDLEQDIGPYHLHDALASISPAVMEAAGTDFAFYHEQAELWRQTGNVSSLKGRKDPSSPEDLAAWTLDKYKNIHILEQTWALKPEMDWYVLIDADTYIVWDNLLAWLHRLDPSSPGWFGSEVFIKGISFTHGGSGTLLSRHTVHDAVEKHPGLAAKWDGSIHEECCGDFMLGKALGELGHKVSNVRPFISGQSVDTMPFLDAYWCATAVTMHHMQPGDMVKFKAFESTREPGLPPIKHVDIFEALIKEPLLASTSLRTDWDSMSWKRELGAGLNGAVGESLPTASADDCASVCDAVPVCMQYTHDGDTCYLGRAARLGVKREAEGAKRWVSGWRVDRIKKWVDRQKGCSGVLWPT